MRYVTFSFQYGESLLWTAIANEHIDMAKFLIDNGANTEFKNCRVVGIHVCASSDEDLITSDESIHSN